MRSGQVRLEACKRPRRLEGSWRAYLAPSGWYGESRAAAGVGSWKSKGG